MLPKPPCITGFIDCDPGNTSNGHLNIPPYSSPNGSVTIPHSDSTSSDGSVVIPHWEGYQNSSSGFGGGQSSSSRSSSEITPAGNQSSSSGSKDLFAVYTVTLKNLTKNPLSGLTISHGPVPFGATFDADRSASGCSFFDKIVGCNHSLDPSETKTFPIVYKITNPMHCRLTPVLQSIRTTFANAVGTTPPATATVQCAVKNGTELEKELAAQKALQDAKEAAKNTKAVYTVNLKNLGSSALKNLTVSHGPVPFGLVFDPTASDRRCSMVDTKVICRQDLGGSKKTSFDIVYKVTDGSRCETTPVLQKVDVTKANSSAAAPVSSNVHCAMKQEKTGTEGSSSSKTGSQNLGTSGSGKALFAEYTVSLKNLTDKPQNAFKISHGPVPSDSVFESGKSSPTCSFGKSTVDCKQSLSASESKTFKIVYRVKSPEHCGTIPALQTVQTAFDGTNGQVGQPPVAASVNCTIVEQDVSVPQDVSTNYPLVALTDEKIPSPQTGANDQYYQSATISDYTISHHEISTIPGVGVTPIFWLSCISMVVILSAIIMKFPLKSALK